MQGEVGNCVSWVDMVNVGSCRHVVQCLANSMLEGVVSLSSPASCEDAVVESLEDLWESIISEKPVSISGSMPQ